MRLPHIFPTAALLISSAAFSLHAQRVLRPAPSGRASSEVSLSYPRPAAAPGTANAPAPTAMAAPAEKPLVIRLEYGQPHLRGRVLHTDSLVPYDKPWRTGASGLTTLTSDVDLVLGGATIAKGTYVLFTIPSRSGWTLIVQKSVGQPAMPYDQVNDVARISLRYVALPTPMESFTIWLIPSLEPGPAKGELRFAWGADQLSTDWSIK